MGLRDSGFRDYMIMGHMGVILGLYTDNGKESGNPRSL